MSASGAATAPTGRRGQGNRGGQRRHRRARRPAGEHAASAPAPWSGTRPPAGCEGRSRATPSHIPGARGRPRRHHSGTSVLTAARTSRPGQAPQGTLSSWSPPRWGYSKTGPGRRRPRGRSGRRGHWSCSWWCTRPSAGYWWLLAPRPLASAQGALDRPGGKTTGPGHRGAVPRRAAPLSGAGRFPRPAGRWGVSSHLRCDPAVRRSRRAWPPSLLRPALRAGCVASLLARSPGGLLRTPAPRGPGDGLD